MVTRIRAISASIGNKVKLLLSGANRKLFTSRPRTVWRLSHACVSGSRVHSLPCLLSSQHIIANLRFLTVRVLDVSAGLELPCSSWPQASVLRARKRTARTDWQCLAASSRDRSAVLPCRYEALRALKEPRILTLPLRGAL